MTAPDVFVERTKTKRGRRVLWQVFARLIDQGRRLSAVRPAEERAACEILGLEGLSQTQLYDSLDWLDERQAKIEDTMYRLHRDLRLILRRQIPLTLPISLPPSSLLSRRPLKPIYMSGFWGVSQWMGNRHISGIQEYTDADEQNNKAPLEKIKGGFNFIPRRRPTLPPGYPGSTIGAGGLNGRVRNGNGCGPSAITTGKTLCLIGGIGVHRNESGLFGIEAVRSLSVS